MYTIAEQRNENQAHATSVDESLIWSQKGLLQIQVRVWQEWQEYRWNVAQFQVKFHSFTTL